MSWSELERLVEEGEADGVIRRGLRHCRSRQELLLAAQRLGYGIGSADLRLAWELHCQETLGGQGPMRRVPRSEEADRSDGSQTGEPLPLAC